MRIKLISFMLIVFLVASNSLWGFSVSYFAPSLYTSDITALNDTLGITGYLFEDFDDNVLLPGLTVTAISNESNPWFANYTESVWTDTISSSRPYSPSASWSGNYTIYPQTVANIHTFSFEEGISSFGFGIAEIDDIGGPHRIYINGTIDTGIVIEDLEGFVRTGYRNMYIRIDSEAGEVINSVTLKTMSSVESLFFSHLAMSEDPLAGSTGNVPEINSICLLGLSLYFVNKYWRKK